MEAEAKHSSGSQQAVTPYLCVSRGSEAIAFYTKAFGATERLRIEHEGKIGHAELEIGKARIMLSDEWPEQGVLSPPTIGGSPVLICLYVDDIDRFAEEAVAAGLKILQRVDTQFYGDRGGKFEDPFGHRWWIATRREDVSPEEVIARAAKLYAKGNE